MRIFASLLALRAHNALVQNLSYRKAEVSRSFPTAVLPAIDRLTVDSSDSHEETSLMCDEYGQAWRGRGKQAVRKHSTGEPVVTDS